MLKAPIAPPRSPTPVIVVGSALVLASLFLKNEWALAVAVFGALLFLLTYQPLYDETIKGPGPSAAIPAALDFAYVLVTSIIFGPIVLLSVAPAVAFAAAYLALLRLRGRSPATVAAGSCVLASLYFFFLSVIGKMSWRSEALGALFVLFNLSQVEYVESSLGFRRTWAHAPVVLAALMALPALLISPCFLLTVAEPLEKAIFERRKALKAAEVKAIGIREVASYLIFVVLSASIRLAVLR